MKLYIINENGSRNYKIGIAKDVDSRLSSLQTSNSCNLSIIAEFSPKNAQRLEKALHKEFSLCNIRGEWFKMNAYTLRYCILIAIEASSSHKLSQGASTFMSYYQLGVYKVMPAIFITSFSVINVMAYQSGMILPFLFTIPLIGLFIWFSYNFFWLKTERNIFYGLIIKVIKYMSDIVSDIRFYIPKKEKYQKMQKELYNLRERNDNGNMQLIRPNNTGKKYRSKKGKSTKSDIIDSFYSFKNDTGKAPSCMELSECVKYSYSTVHRTLTKEGLI